MGGRLLQKKGFSGKQRGMGDGIEDTNDFNLLYKSIKLSNKTKKS